MNAVHRSMAWWTVPIGSRLEPAVACLLRSSSPHCDVYMKQHHGSSRSFKVSCSYELTSACWRSLQITS